MQNESTTQPPRRCVYTALTGRYERLNEQAVAARSSIPFICLTDDPELKSDTWQIRRITPPFAADPARSQRDFKLRPHVHLPDFDASLYIDNSVLLKEPPELLFERHFPASGFCLPRHSFRASILDEFIEVAKLGFDDQGRIFEQLNHYLADWPEVLREQPYWAGIMLRDHRNPRVREMLEIWLAHVYRYSRRDQLSCMVAFRQAGLVPDVLDVDNHASWFHTWPHALERKREPMPGDPAPLFNLAPVRLRQLEQALAEQTARADALARQLAALPASRGARLRRALRDYSRHSWMVRWMGRG